MKKLALISLLGWWGALLLFPQLSCAQSFSWEFSPYKIEVWLTPGQSPTVTSSLLTHVEEGFRDQAKIVANAAWDVHFSRPTADVAGEIFLPEYALGYDRLKTALPEIATYDKLFALQIDEDQRGYVITARQFDVRTRSWDAPREKITPQAEQLPFAVWDVVAQGFAPIVRVEKVADQTISGRVRAGGLVVNLQENPAAVQPGDALQPILRRNDRSGEPPKVGGINFVPWSVVNINERADAVVTGTMFSGVRFPLPSRGGVRVERLALKINPRLPSTKLVVEARTAERQPLEGYDVFSKLPNAEDAQLLGRTDWRGSFVIPPRETKLQILYIRSGGKLLIRLPVVAGATELMEVRLVDDQQRLQADGLIAALHSRITDLVARREILAARIRILLKQGKFEEADALVSQYRQLENRNDLLKMLDEQQPTVRSSEKQTQAKIDKLFSDARKLLGKFLDPQTVEALHAEVQKAKANPGSVVETEPNAPTNEIQPTAPTQQPTTTPPVTPAVPATTPAPAITPVPPTTPIPPQPMS